MKQIRNKLTDRVVACKVIDSFTPPYSTVLVVEEWDGDEHEEFGNKIICVDNFDREVFGDILIAESSDLSKDDFDKLDQLVNRDHSPNYFMQVEKSRKLYKYIP